MSASTRAILFVAVLLGATNVVSAAEKLPSAAPSPAGALAAPSASSAGVTPEAANPVGKAELIYVPVTPCRVFNTPASIAAGKTVALQVTGAGDLRSQGGPSGGCGVPAYAKSVSISLTAIPGSVAGSFTAYTAGTPKPLLVSLRYRANEAATSTATIALSAAGKLNVYSTKAARAVGDVTGYYAEQIQGLVSAGGSIYSGSSGLVSVQKTAVGEYKVTVDRDVTFCTPVVIPYYGKGYYGSAYAFDKNIVTVYVWSLNSSGQPVASDAAGYSYIAVHC